MSFVDVSLPFFKGKSLLISYSRYSVEGSLGQKKFSVIVTVFKLVTENLFIKQLDFYYSHWWVVVGLFQHKRPFFSKNKTNWIRCKVALNNHLFIILQKKWPETKFKFFVCNVNEHVCQKRIKNLVSLEIQKKKRYCCSKKSFL